MRAVNASAERGTGTGTGTASSHHLDMLPSTHHERMAPPVPIHMPATCPYSLFFIKPTFYPISLFSHQYLLYSNFQAPRRPSIMSDQSKQPASQKSYDSTPSSSRQAVKFLTAATIGTILMVLSGLTLTGTVIALIVATPALVVFSPILVPGGIVIFLATTGFLFSGCCGLTALMALSWLYEYVAGKHPPGADQLDYARMRIANKARDMKERAKEYGQYVHHKVQEAAATQPS